ncbi:MAG: hypothetical protein IPI23_19350 [Bacteroidetes bacterium]|nr:hypothetical protein [Bacteroidota bacterium]
MLIYLLYNIGSVRNALNELSIEPLYPYITTTEQVFNYKLISFIGATILLPLLSGICLSIGLGIISNINNLRESNKKVIDLNEKINQLETESNNINMIKSTLKTIYDDFDEKDKNKLTDLTELFENSYVQGYKKGHRTQFGYEIYENINSQYIDAINS